jgi:predicted nucleic acid-binding protein
VYRELRRRGVTVRSTIDCLIAALAEQHRCAILARDRDLERIVGSGLLKVSLGA